MANQQQRGGNRGGSTQYREPTPSKFSFDDVLRATEEKQKLIKSWLDIAKEKIRAALPESLKPHVDRFVSRAMLYFSERPELLECTERSFVQCVLEAASLGVPIDGRLAYVIPRKTTVKDISGAPVFENGKKKFIWEATFALDYKGLRLVAKRCGQIKDIEPEVICENDHFEHGRNDAGNYLSHTWDAKKPRGKIVGAVVRLWFPDGDWRYELLDELSIVAIEAKSESAKGANSPWRLFRSEMVKKAAMRRTLKQFEDDPGVALALEYENRDYKLEELDEFRGAGTDRPIGDTVPATKTQQIKDRLKDKPAERPEETEYRPAAGDYQRPDLDFEEPETSEPDDEETEPSGQQEKQPAEKSKQASRGESSEAISDRARALSAIQNVMTKLRFFKLVDSLSPELRADPELIDAIDVKAKEFGVNLNAEE